ncbi:patatin-like phospholipase family protein [uncultured Cytophaga sp.]|uniref:patatin-like phospholipase family protein n=1 Tax=uncultured Cytophaga sp. TaxID=160238 RepID=UPI00263901C5|nr:patatin-like phospholipase family protein [uncultured Cytophaga sp.]
MKKKIRILSIDGGGIRGIIPASVAVYIENRLQRITKNPDVRISDYFDFIAGTSTGGILASAYLCPQVVDQTQHRFNATDALRFYLEKGGYIFSAGVWDKMASMGGFLKARYKHEPLEKVLNVAFKQTKISELLKPCLITSYDVELKMPVYFQSHVAKNDTTLDFFVKDACKAAASAPLYFEPSRVQSMSGVSYTLIDGAVYANNPTMCAVSQAAVLFAEKGIPLTIDQFEVVSLGTGRNQKVYTYEQVKDWGGLGWLNPLLDVMINGASEVIESELIIQFRSMQAIDQYHRIQPDLIGDSQEMDDASPENIQRLMEISATTIEKYKDELEVIVNRLINN